MGEDRLSSIQALRGAAALAVVAHHAVATVGSAVSSGAGMSSPVVATFAALGASGVDLFFVISGFVMAHVAGRNSDGGAARFLINRLIRIVPMFWLMSALYIGWMVGRGTVFPAAAYLNTISVVPIVGGDPLPALYVGWTLAFELLFYLVAAGVIAVAARPEPWLTIAMVLAATIGLFPRLHAVAPQILNPIVGEFALGGAAWLEWRAGRIRISPSALILAGVLMLFLTLVDPWTPSFSVHPALVESGASSVRRLAFWGVPCALIVLGAARAAAPHDDVVTRSFSRVGDASFSIYLSHPLAFEIAGYFLSGGRGIAQVPYAAALFAVALLFGSGVHALIERPLLRATRQGWAALNRVVHGKRALSTA